MKKHKWIKKQWRTYRGLWMFGLLLGLMLMLLGGCATNTPASDYCLLYQPVYSHADDTEQTKIQIDGNNAVYDELCL